MFSQCTLLSSITLPNNIVGINSNCFQYCSKLTSINLNNIISIGSQCFDSCTLLSNVTLSPNITYIGYNCFVSCNAFTSFNFPPKITTIAASLLQSCQNIVSVSIPNGVIEMQDGVLYGCSKLETINLPSTLQKVGNYCFLQTAITSIVLPDSLTTTNNPVGVFKYCTSLKNITFPNNNPNFKSIAAWFQNTGLIELTNIPKTVTNITGCVSYSTNITTFVCPENLTSIGDNTFLQCTSLNNVTLNNSLTTIGAAVFQGCSKLISITIPGSITSIGGGSCFSGMPNLTVTFQGISTSIKNMTITNGTFVSSNNNFIFTNSTVNASSITPSQLSTNYSTQVANGQYVPLAPSSISFNSATNILSWQPVSTATTYTLYSGGSNNFTSGTTIVSIVPTTSYTLIGIPAEYYFGIKANNAIGSSGFSPIIHFTIGCFLKDSKVLTKNGMIPIQKLKKNDLVKTLNHGLIPIKFVGKTSFFNKSTEERINAHLYKLNKKDFPELKEDLYITGGHPLLMDEKDLDKETKNKLLDMAEMGTPIITEGKYRVFALIHPKAELWNDEGMKEIYDIVLENDDPHRNYGIYVNGILTESMDEHFFLNYSKMTEINTD
jgi:hypothetical protein